MKLSNFLSQKNKVNVGGFNTLHFAALLISSLTFGSCSITKNIRTNDNDDLHVLMGEPGFVNGESSYVYVDSTCYTSKSLCKAIETINSEYDNHKVQIGGKEYKGRTAAEKCKCTPHGRAHFNALTNTSHIWDYETVPFDTLNNKIQIMLIKDWIAEMTHAKQLKEQGLAKFFRKVAIDNIKNIGSEYEKLYDTYGTYEHDHYESEKNHTTQLYNLMYKHADRNDLDDIALLFMCYYSTFGANESKINDEVYHKLREHTIKEFFNGDVSLYFDWTVKAVHGHRS